MFEGEREAERVGVSEAENTRWAGCDNQTQQTDLPKSAYTISGMQCGLEIINGIKVAVGAWLH